MNSAKSSPDAGFVFTFGGTQSSQPEVWDIREVQEGKLIKKRLKNQIYR